MKSASDFLGEDGPFSETVDGFRVRPPQQQLSEAIEDALHNTQVLVAEAGTGIGKTFAYLVPALLSGKKVIISTGTRHLQDQLFHTDIPRVVKALDINIKTALLKGRSNYLCLHRLNLAPHMGFTDPDTRSLISDIKEWSGTTRHGDLSELTSIEENAYVFSLVSSTADSCLGSDCEYWDDCHVVKARRRAQDTDLLVINHHLLLADMTIKEEGFAELLPGAEAFIIDEAHQLYDIASRFFGASVSSRQITGLCRDAIAEHINDAPDMADIRDYADQLENAAHDLRMALGESGQRQAWSRVIDRETVRSARQNLMQNLEQLSEQLEQAAERSRGLDQCYQRCLQIIARLEKFCVDEDRTVAVLWYETYAKSFVLNETPIEVASKFQQHTDHFSSSWLFTSATLQVNNDFSHFAHNMGLEDFISDTWDSPFDYSRQSVLYLPPGMPEPSDPTHTATLMSKIKPVLEATKGRAFLLFTSYRAMHEAARLLEQQDDYPLFIQGERPKHQLLKQFRETEQAVLIGTSSFWEGVDVRGEALSCVVIDKLPFASPGDPVMQARIDAIREQGGQPFMEYQLPRAVLTLKQGVGRLIRDIDDYGVIVIGDPRIKHKSYGKIFIDSLPAIPKTQDISKVERFFRERETGSPLETACN